MKKNNMMKKETAMNRMVALVLAVLFMFSIFTGCSSRNANAAETFGVNKENQVTVNTNETNNNAQESNGNPCEELEALKVKLEEELKAAKAENEALKAENASLKEQVVPAVEVKNGVVYCDVEYFLERATVIFEDNTAALMAIENGTPVTLDDVHALDNRANYRDNTFELPREDYRIAVTFNGKDVQIANFGTYHWASNSLFLNSKANTGYKLVETEKKGSLGDFAQLLQIVAVCVENAEAEYGYDFYVKAGWNAANPVVKPSAPQKPECPDEDKKPIVKPEIEPDDEPEEKPVERPENKPENKPDDSDHNDLEDIPNPNEPDEDVKPGHNDLEEIPNPNKPENKPNEDDTTKNPEDSSENDGNKNEDKEDDEVIDTTLNPEDPSNDEGNHNNKDDENQNDNIIEDDEVIDTTLNPEDPSNDESSHSKLEDSNVNSNHSSLD